MWEGVGGKEGNRGFIDLNANFKEKNHITLIIVTNIEV